MRKDRQHIVVTGARANNLKGVDLRIPLGLLTVVTGVSGSGKSSIAFGTIAVESQRQLNEVFPAFIRNRLPRYERPEFDLIENLAPAIVVDQKPVGGGSRSTVGTMTEVNPVLRVLFSRYGEPSAGPSNFYSFNDPQGMCPHCDGLGATLQLDVGKLLDLDKSLNEGAIRHANFAVGTNYWKRYAQISRYEKGRAREQSREPVFDPDKPLSQYTKKEMDLLLYGEGFQTVRPDDFDNVAINDYEGIVPRVTRRFVKPGLEALKDKERKSTEQVVTERTCPQCRGARLSQAALESRIDGRNIADYCAMEIGDLVAALEEVEHRWRGPVVPAALASLRRIASVGLGYLTLNRPTRTLSGGEGQRLKAVRHLGSALTGMTYIFDEPSVGLHAHDVDRLNRLLLDLRDKGNTVLIVEHNRDVIAIADHVVDVGPGAGAEGGEIVFTGTVEELADSKTLTGRHFRTQPPLKKEPRTSTGKLPVRGAGLHNLRGFDIGFPTGVLTVVTGVAGSGKSTLVSHVFTAQHPQAIVLDQSAVGMNPRSTPATYTGIWDTVRKLFAKEHGLDASMFSFNSKGACSECKGRGTITTDLAFMDPVTTVCELCGGTRFRQEVLEHRVKGRNIAEVLDLTVTEARGFFDDPAIVRRLDPLAEVGLGYLTLGRSLSMLSGGERQRVKLADRLHEQGSVYVFDEPTTGLHMADVGNLLALLDRLVDSGNTVIAIEHDLDVAKHADWIVDIGPGAGEHGGQVVFAGTPAEMVDGSRTTTARYLRASLPGAETAGAGQVPEDSGD
ncbi:ATP-binding cassette domain-containing protein [Streptomyces candidus]|uniref:UvrABC system protein A n=1 Tax=Streptomyces candidus TaxID=67283 RepID=A0A7X0HFP3_9ACTN|nr:excinuclease ABC subunit UvrA [Streptomyces candidus]MBB6436780.1 excinuclease UvrABC ATPase subunit [Streptomyces candidus]GHH51377.1 thiamine ABC transporter permease [Streptomyces candidus]